MKTNRIQRGWAILLALGATCTASSAWVTVFDDTAFTNGGAIYQTISAEHRALKINRVRYWTLDGRDVTVALAPGLHSMQEVFDQAWLDSGFETDRYKPLGAASGSHTSTLYMTDDDDIQGAGGRQVDFVNTPNGLVEVGASDDTHFADGGSSVYEVYGSIVYKMEVNPAGVIGTAGNPAQHTIAGGYYHSLGLKMDGTVVCWGSDEYGQSTEPDPNANFVSVGAGRYHSLGVKADGTVACWGDNGYGQCTPPDPNSGFVAADGGRYHSVAVRSDGTVAAWGRNNYGQTGLPIPNADFRAVAAGYYHNVALKSDGSIVCWGNNGDGQCDVPEPNTNFIAVAAGYYHSAGLKSDGSVVCWGSDSDDQCTVPAPNANFTAIGAGQYHTMGLKADGTIVCWGDNGDGQCDVPDPNANFAAVARGYYHTLGMKEDGSVVCWGYVEEGQCDVPAPNGGFNPGSSSGVSPSSGSITGGYAVVITGTDLCEGADVTNVTLCGVSAASIESQSVTQIVVVASPGPMGVGDVRVFSTSCRETVKSNGFTYTVAAMGLLGVNGEAIASGESASMAKGTEFSVKLDTTNGVTLTVTNIGNGTLAITGVSTSGAAAAQFIVENYPASLPGYGAGPLTVACQGTALGACSAALTVTSDGTNSPYVVNVKGLVYQTSADSGPSAGGNRLTITYGLTGSGDITNVLVDGVAATIDGQSDGWVRILMPAHVDGGVTIVIQGPTVSATFNSAYTYNPAGWIGGPRVDAWVDVPGLPTERMAVGGGMYNGALYVVGGRNNSGVFYSTNVFMFDGTNWTETVGLPRVCTSVSCATYDGHLYAIGGLDNVVGYRTNVLKFNGGTWTEVEGLPEAFSPGGGSAVLGSRLYHAPGGTNVYAYDGTNWTGVAGLPIAISTKGLAAFDGALYSVGGQADVGGAFCTNVYRFDGTSWTEVEGLPGARRGINCVTTNGALLAIGGHDGSSGTTNVFRFDGTHWTEVRSGYPRAIYEPSAFGEINGLVYGVAGSNMTNVYAFPHTDTGVTPSGGSAAGGYEVVIVGGNLGQGDITNVTLCGISVTNIASQSATQVVVWAGSRESAVTGEVVVYSTSYGMTSKANGFSYTGQTTQVVLYDFFMQEVIGGVSVCWQTASEEKTVGFDLYRWQDGAWVKVNGAFVYAQGADGLGASYCVVDGGANATDEFRYKLVETESGGGTQEYGPFDVAAWGLRLDNVVASAEGVTIRWLGRAQDTYEIWKSVDLMRGFERLASGIAGVEPVTSFTDENAVGNAFYRIRAERE